MANIVANFVIFLVISSVSLLIFGLNVYQENPTSNEGDDAVSGKEDRRVVEKLLDTIELLQNKLKEVSVGQQSEQNGHQAVSGNRVPRDIGKLAGSNYLDNTTVGSSDNSDGRNLAICPFGQACSCNGPPGPMGPRGLPGRDGRDGREFTSCGEEKSVPPPLPNNRGALYTRWGVSHCPGDSQLIYSGVTGGTRFTSTGGGANILCLPDNPVYDSTVAGMQEHRAVIQTAEYEGHDFPPFSNLANQDVACAVCNTLTRPLMLMIPARNICTAGNWTLEYSGYLMTERSTSYNHHRSQYICMDKNSLGVQDTWGSFDGLMLYPVERACPYGDLCGNYTNGYELSCVVCTM